MRGSLACKHSCFCKTRAVRTATQIAQETFLGTHGLVELKLEVFSYLATFFCFIVIVIITLEHKDNTENCSCRNLGLSHQILDLRPRLTMVMNAANDVIIPIPYPCTMTDKLSSYCIVLLGIKTGSE